MEKIELEYQCYHIEDLPSNLFDLVASAVESTERSYAPYSLFNVGAAALMEDGAIYTGVNIESVAFPAGMCAERVLLFSLLNDIVRSKQRIQIIAIAATKNDERVSVSPCGICRQTLIDVEQRQKADIAVLFPNGDRYILVPSAKMLMPFSFNKI